MGRRRFLLAGHDAGGTVPPMLAVAEALIALDHEVIVLSQPSVRRRAEAAGCTFAAFSHVADYERGTPIEEQFQLVLEALTGKSVGDDVIALTKQHEVDALVVDANLGGALAAAEKLSQPSAVLLHSMYKTFIDVWMGETWSLLGPAVNQTRERFGLGAAHDWPSAFAGHERLLAVVPAAFDAPVAVVPDSMRHFGFLVPRGETTAVTTPFPPGDDPTVLVGLSTTYQRQGELLETIIGALGDLSVRALVTTAGQADIEALPKPPNVVITDFVPHRLVLDRTDVMVTHAGLGTIAAALAFGVPLVCTPVGRDQPLNAHRVSELGAGVALTDHPSSGAIGDAIGRVLATGTFGDAARSLAAASTAAGGAPAVAAELRALLD